MMFLPYLQMTWIPCCILVTTFISLKVQGAHSLNFIQIKLLLLLESHSTNIEEKLYTSGSICSGVIADDKTHMDNLLKVADLDSVGDIAPEDMEEMLKVNSQLLEFNVSKEDMDNLLNIDCFYPMKSQSSDETS